MCSLSEYEINYDVDRFSFIKTKKIIDFNHYRDNYNLNWEEITSEYLSVGIGNVPHFASQYVLAQALNNGRISEREEMQTKYIDIITRIKELIELGELPKSF